MVISEGIEEAVPSAYAQLLGITTLVCTPMSAGGYAYGVICADRGGGRFELSDGERHLLWTLGKTAALVAAARNVTRQQERTRRLGERLDLAREIHESVLQRLFGVSLALGAEQPFDRDERERCRIEMQEALERPAPRARAPAGSDSRPRPGRRWRPSSIGCASRPGMVVEVDWRGRDERAARPRAARPVGARRGAAQHRQARRSLADRGRGGARQGRRSPSRSATTASARARETRHGAAAGGVRGAPAGRVWSSSGRSPVIGGASGSSCPLQQRPRVMDTTGDRAARAGRRRPRRRALGLSACCSASSRGSSASSRPAPAPRRWRCARPHKPHVALVDLFLADESGAELSTVDPRGLARHARAADLGRRADVAGRGPGRRRLRVRVQGLGRRAGRGGRAPRRARDDRRSRPRPSNPRRCSPSASARCST